MIREKSCGAVVFAYRAGERIYLIERMRKGHISICKGHVEGAETEHQTAAREIMEETSLSVTFIDGFRRVISYSPYEGCVKDVVFFAARAQGTETKPQPEEVNSLEWLPLAEALTALTHVSDRETLLEADRFLNTLPVEPRPMRRASREMSRERCVEVLERCTSGVLAVTGDGGYPYAVPLSYVYRDGRIYFHGAKKGHKLDALLRDPRCSFCVVDRDQVVPERYTTKYRSVIAFGRARAVTDADELRQLIVPLAEKYNPEDSAEHRQAYIDEELAAMTMIELTVERMTEKEN